jgi:hypothetical protein
MRLIQGEDLGYDPLAVAFAEFGGVCLESALPTAQIRGMNRL